MPDGRMEQACQWKGYSDYSATVPRTVEYTTADKHGGKSALHVVIFQGASEWPLAKGPTFATQTGKGYRIRFWAKIPVGSATVGVRNGADTDWNWFHAPYLNARDWTYYDFIYPEKAGGPGARVAVWSAGGLMEMFLDDVSVTEVDLSKEAVLAGWRKAVPGASYICWQKVSPWEKLNALQLAPKSPKQCVRIKLAMGTNEYESTSFVITNLTDQPRRFTVKPGASDLQLTLRQAAWITAYSGNSVNDALPLLDGPLDVPSGESREVWITLNSKGARPGSHRTRITVTSPELGDSAIDLSTKIYPVALPEDKPVYTYYWDDIVPTSISAEKAQAMTLDLKAHYANVASVHPVCVPPMRVDSSGKLVTDYKELDAALGNYKALDPAMLLFFWNAGAYFEPGVDGGKIKFMGDEWKTLFKEWLTDWVRHMKDLGYGYDSYAMYPYDETINPTVCSVAKLIKEVDPKVMVYVNNTGSTVDEVRNIAPYVDIWCPFLYDYLNNPPYQDRLEAKKAADQLLKKNPQFFWTYANPPGSAPEDAPPYRDYRLGPWRAWDLGMMGYGFWIYLYKSHWENYKHSDGPNWSVAYLSDAPDAPKWISKKEIVVPGKRWEATREGVEDFVYLWMLQQAVESPDAAAKPAALKQGKLLLDTLPKRVLAQDTNSRLADQAKEDVLRILDRLGVGK